GPGRSWLRPISTGTTRSGLGSRDSPTPSSTGNPYPGPGQSGSCRTSVMPPTAPPPNPIRHRSPPSPGAWATSWWTCSRPVSTGISGIARSAVTPSTGPPAPMRPDNACRWPTAPGSTTCTNSVKRALPPPSVGQKPPNGRNFPWWCSSCTCSAKSSTTVPRSPCCVTCTAPVGEDTRKTAHPESDRDGSDHVQRVHTHVRQVLVPAGTARRRRDLQGPGQYSDPVPRHPQQSPFGPVGAVLGELRAHRHRAQELCLLGQLHLFQEFTYVFGTAGDRDHHHRRGKAELLPFCQLPPGEPRRI